MKPSNTIENNTSVLIEVDQFTDEQRTLTNGYILPMLESETIEQLQERKNNESLRMKAEKIEAKEIEAQKQANIKGIKRSDLLTRTIETNYYKVATLDNEFKVYELGTVTTTGKEDIKKAKKEAIKLFHDTEAIVKFSHRNTDTYAMTITDFMKYAIKMVKEVNEIDLPIS